MRKKVPQTMPQTDSALRPRPGESWDFFKFFQNYTPLWGGQLKKSILRLPTGSMGRSMPNLVGILPVVWAPNPNKQTDRQTDRPFIYIIRKRQLLKVQTASKSFSCNSALQLNKKSKASSKKLFIILGR